MPRFCSLKDAVQETAAGHEVIRQRRRHPTLVRMTPDLPAAHELDALRAMRTRTADAYGAE